MARGMGGEGRAGQENYGISLFTSLQELGRRLFALSPLHFPFFSCSLPTLPISPKTDFIFISLSLFYWDVSFPCQNTGTKHRHTHTHTHTQARDCLLLKPNSHISDRMLPAAFARPGHTSEKVTCSHPLSSRLIMRAYGEDGAPVAAGKHLLPQ